MVSPLFAAVALVCTRPIVIGANTFRCGSETIVIENIDVPAKPGDGKCRTKRIRRLRCDAQAAEVSERGLARLIQGARLKIRRIGQDADGRTLARVMANGSDLGEQMVRRGWARRWD